MSTASAADTQTPLPAAVSLKGNSTGPLTPGAPGWMCAAVAVMPVRVMRAVNFLVTGSRLTRPLPVAVEVLVGTSCAAVICAAKTWRPICPRISPPGFSVLWALKYKPPAANAVAWASVTTVFGGTAHMPLPAAVSASGTMTAPLTPMSPRCTWAAVAVIPFSEIAPLNSRDGEARDSVPVPRAPVTVGVGSWSPESEALKVAVVLGGSSEPLLQAASDAASTPAAIHLRELESRKLWKDFIIHLLVGLAVTWIGTLPRTAVSLKRLS